MRDIFCNPHAYALPCRTGDDKLVAADNEFVVPDNDDVVLRATGPLSSQIDGAVVCGYEFVVDAYEVFVGGSVFVVKIEGQRLGRVRVGRTFAPEATGGPCGRPHLSEARSAELCGLRGPEGASLRRKGARPVHGRGASGYPSATETEVTVGFAPLKMPPIVMV